MSPIYFGAAPLVLALLALSLPGRRGWKCSMLVLALLFLGCTLGTTLPMRGWLYDFVPPTRYFRHPNMFRVYFIVAVLVLAALATRKLELWRREGVAPTAPMQRFAFAAVVLAACGMGVLLFSGSGLRDLGADAPAALLHAGLAWGGLAAVAFAMVRRPQWITRLPAALVVLATIDLLGAHYLSAECAYQLGQGSARPVSRHSPVDLGPENFARGFITAGNQHLYVPAPVYCSYAALLNVQHVLSAESGELMRFAVGRDRIWFAPGVVETPLTEEAIALLKKEVATRRAPVLMWHPRESMIGGLHGGAFGSEPADATAVLDAEAVRRAPSAVPVPFEVQTYRANELSLRVNAPSEGWLLVTDRWSRSWRASVNGVEVPVDGGNFFFRLVPVRAGQNVVAMQFEPFLLWPMLVLSWGTLLGVALSALLASLRRRVRFSSPVPNHHHVLPCAVS